MNSSTITDSSNWQACIVRMLPDEQKSLAIQFHVHQTVYGDTLVANTNKGICFIAFGEKGKSFDELKTHFPNAVFKPVINDLQLKAIEAINYSEPISRKLPLHLKGTDFEMEVWQALLAIPTGETTSYGNIARMIGKPKAVRAVASAIGRNPIACLIPCHRIFRTDGKIGGYHWGIDIKMKIIENEHTSSIQ